ncbi:2OG-Fe(II) oxygenase [Herbaspirillum sp. WKF16]|uniref:2OG-Fe(II) oxygenase n=1 Tax=Herbaspirillum sp. WKF16 TaxID=3028312 RepID=UPI0023A9C048|nr:2OG-Fe(II) oxygenase [Herbaspirillum sp. WKF16]WDZ95780.1 2OG-Fe(II) oxygenase [Herbaspirillum sp. WKF16]
MSQSETSELIRSPLDTAHFTVASLPGSKPMGGVVADTPVHAFRNLPAALRFASEQALKPARTDLVLPGLMAFIIDNVVTATEADALIAWSEKLGYRSEAPGISTPPGMRMNKTVHWVAEQDLLGPILERISPLLPKEIDGDVLHDRLSHRINMYRYDADDVFNRHLDGDWPGFGLSADGTSMLEWPGLRSKLTMLLYLNDANDGVRGGSTLLYGHRGEILEVQPRKGAALFFRHGFHTQSVAHVGARVDAGTPKYVARINVMYEQGNNRLPRRD